MDFRLRGNDDYVEKGPACTLRAGFFGNAKAISYVASL